MKIVEFDKSYAREDFSCGKPALDEWLQRYAGQSDKSNTTRTFLGVGENSNRIHGYYAMKACELDLDDAALAFGVGKRRYPVPAMLLVRLAVDTDYQGTGVGKRLLVDALERLVDVSRSIGYEVVVVDSIDMEASTFYRKYGFTNFTDMDLKLFMTTKTLKATFDAAGS